MLGKLIKYDFKALNRYLLVIHGMLLITALLGRFLFIGRIVDHPEGGAISKIGVVVMTFGIFLFVILFMAAVFGTLLLTAIHFYKKLYSDEGYLTHTLPVTRGQLLISKTVTGSVWVILDMALVILSVIILVLYKPFISELAAHKNEILTDMGFPASVGYGKIMFALFILLVLSAVANVVTIYVSIALGQLFSSHRILGAVVVYFAVNMILGILSGVLGTAYSMSSVVHMTDASGFYDFYVKTFLLSGAGELFIVIVSYVATYLLLQKKLNLN